MGLIKKILAGLLGVAVIVVIVGIFLPSKWEVTRSATIKVAPAAIYPMLADMKTGWTQWSAFDLEDPNITYSYSGAPTGEGSERAWKSEKMGNGKMKITKADPNKGIEYTLEMTDNNFLLMGVLKMEADGDGTKVTWTDVGDVGSNIFYKYMVAGMDKMMGPTFERSLNTLKTKVESSVKR